MEIRSVSPECGIVVLNVDEAIFLTNAVNEAIRALDDRDLQMRTGARPDEAARLSDELGRLADLLSASMKRANRA